MRSLEASLFAAAGFPWIGRGSPGPADLYPAGLPYAAQAGGGLRG